EDIDKKLLDNNTKEVYGDRRVVNYAVGYYLTILTYFDVLSKEKNKYFWKNRKLTVSNDILKEILIVYSQLRDDFEIDVASIYDEVPFKFINLENLETVLMEFNSKDWSYQKRFNSKKVIVKNKYKHFSLE
ncbi:MAG: hypothetical protein LBR24_03745, partial [Methanobrevibacter sp.]|nr:hypothetical protein [Methanobrevibacter sp.]